MRTENLQTCSRVNLACVEVGQIHLSCEESLSGKLLSAMSIELLSYFAITTPKDLGAQKRKTKQEEAVECLFLWEPPGKIVVTD